MPRCSNDLRVLFHWFLLTCRTSLHSSRLFAYFQSDITETITNETLLNKSCFFFFFFFFWLTSDVGETRLFEINFSRKAMSHSTRSYDTFTPKFTLEDQLVVILPIWSALSWPVRHTNSRGDPRARSNVQLTAWNSTCNTMYSRVNDKTSTGERAISQRKFSTPQLGKSSDFYHGLRRFPMFVSSFTDFKSSRFRSSSLISQSVTKMRLHRGNR